ncbi:MAG: hypothetical protein ACO1OB_34370, partial [Archangium sp.]
MNFRAIVAVTAVVLSASCGTRPTCDSSTCATGCCDASGTCRVPTNLACGTSGASCTQCQAAASCVLGVCSNGS